MPQIGGKFMQQPAHIGFFGGLKIAGVNFAGLGGHVNQFVVVERNVQLLRQQLSDFPSAAAMLPADGNDGLLGSVCRLFRMNAPVKFSCPLKAFLGNDNGNHFVDYRCCGNGALDDLGALRSGGAQDGNGNSRKYQGYAGMGQQGQAQIFFHGCGRLGDGGPKIGAEIFTRSPGQNVHSGKDARTQHQVVIQRRTQVHNYYDHQNVQNRVEYLHDLFQSGFADQIGEGSGKCHADEHEVQHGAGHHHIVKKETHTGGGQDQGNQQRQGLTVVPFLF